MRRASGVVTQIRVVLVEEDVDHVGLSGVRQFSLGFGCGQWIGWDGHFAATGALALKYFLESPDI